MWVIREFSILSSSEFSNYVYVTISIWICGTVFWVFFCPWFEMAKDKWAITGFLFSFGKSWYVVFGFWPSVHFGLVPYLHQYFSFHWFWVSFCFVGVHAYSLFDKSPKLCPFFIYLFHLVLFILFYFNPRAISIFHKTALVKLTPSSLIWLLF